MCVVVIRQQSIFSNLKAHTTHNPLQQVMCTSFMAIALDDLCSLQDCRNVSPMLALVTVGLRSPMQQE